MNIDEKIVISKSRDYIVSKSNQIFTKMIVIRLYFQTLIG